MAKSTLHCVLLGGSFLPRTMHPARCCRLVLSEGTRSVAACESRQSGEVSEGAGNSYPDQWGRGATTGLAVAGDDPRRRVRRSVGHRIWAMHLSPDCPIQADAALAQGSDHQPHLRLDRGTRPNMISRGLAKLSTAACAIPILPPGRSPVLLRHPAEPGQRHNHPPP